MLGLLAVVALTACEARVAAGYRNDGIVSRAKTTVLLSDGRKQFRLRNEQLAWPASNASYPTATEGTLRVEVTMRDAVGAIASGDVVLDLKSDWIWGISLAIDSTDPTRFTFGVLGKKAVPLRPGVGRTPRDSLWITWGGNSIRHPAVY